MAEITEKSLKNVLEVRRVLDMLSAELACERMDEEGKKALEKACRDFEEAIRTGDLREIAQKDVELHNIIVEASGNNVLQHLVGNLSEQMYRYRVKYLKDDSRYKTLIKEHQGIYESIVRREGKTAARLAKEHIDNQESAIMIERQNEKLFMQAAAVLGGLLLSLGFWGIVFPQYLFTGDCVRVVNEEGQDVTEETEDDKNLYSEISEAGPEQIEVRISILEWAKR